MNEYYDIKQKGNVIAIIKVDHFRIYQSDFALLHVIIPEEYDQTKINMRMLDWFVTKYFAESGPVHIAKIHWEGNGHYSVRVVKERKKALKGMEMVKRD